MAWDTEIPLIVRVLINDLASPYQYTDTRLRQVIAVAAQFVKEDLGAVEGMYTIDVSTPNILPDPTDSTARNDVFINCIALKSACIIDQSTLRTKAASEGIRAALGPASLSVSGNMVGFKILLDEGPCALYSQFISNYDIANATNIASILSPFIGNQFDPRLTNANLGSFYRHGEFYNEFYS
jgi:hypothetical protein